MYYGPDWLDIVLSDWKLKNIYWFHPLNLAAREFHSQNTWCFTFQWRKNAVNNWLYTILQHTCLVPVYNKAVLILIYHLYITLLYTLHLLFYPMIGQLRSQNEVMHFLRTIFFRQKNCNQILHALSLVYKCQFTFTSPLIGHKIWAMI